MTTCYFRSDFQHNQTKIIISLQIKLIFLNFIKSNLQSFHKAKSLVFQIPGALIMLIAHLNFRLVQEGRLENNVNTFLSKLLLPASCKWR